MSEPQPPAWMKTFSVTWTAFPYVHGDGLRVVCSDRLYELIPYVESGRAGGPHGYAVTIDYQHFGQVRVPGEIERAIAEAELMMMEQAEKDRRPESDGQGGRAGGDRRGEGGPGARKRTVRSAAGGGAR